MRRFLTVTLSAICFFMLSGCGSSSGGDNSAEYVEVKSLADEFTSKILIKEDFASLIDNDEFLYSGMNAEEYITDTIANVEAVNYKIIFNDSHIEKISDGLYKFYEINKVDILENNIVVKEETLDAYAAQEVTGYIKKINGTWYCIGNQRKVHIEASFGENNLWFDVKEHISYPITNVTLTSPTLQTPIHFDKQDSDWWSLYIDSDQNNEGKAFTITVNYSDGTMETQTYVIPKNIERKITINSAIINGNGTVTVSYSVPVDDSSSYVLAWVNDFEVYKILQGNNKTLNIPADAFQSGANIIYLGFFDIYNRYYQTRYNLTY